MSDIQIIKTDNPDVVIERKIIDREINIQDLIQEKSELENNIIENISLLEQLKSINVPEILLEVYEIKKQECQQVIDIDNDRIKDIDLLLNSYYGS